MIEYVKWSINDWCNLFCSYCNMQREEIPALSYSDQTRILDKMFAEGVKYVDFYGKEPLFDRTIFNLVAYSKHKGYNFKFSFISNGLNFKKYKREVILSDFDSVTFSYDPEKRERDFNVNLEDIKCLADNTPVEIAFDIHSGNSLAVKKCIPIFRVIGVDSIFLNPIIGKSSYEISEDDYENLIEELINDEANRPYMTVKIPYQFVRLTQKYQDAEFDNGSYITEEECCAGESLYIDCSGIAYGCSSIPYSKNGSKYSCNYLSTPISKVENIVRSRGERLCDI